MLKSKLYELELDLKYRIFQDQKKLSAVKSIKELLHQIDFSAEKVLFDKEKLTSLLLELKGEDLTEDEKVIVNELVK